VRKLSFAIAVLATLGGASLATSASAAPGAPMGVTAPDAVTHVYMTPMERRMDRRMERRHMERRMMRRDMRRGM
jgi:ABC-type sugar transport system substrate-binding protein